MADANLWGVCGWFGEIDSEIAPAQALSAMAGDLGGSREAPLSFVDPMAAVALSAGTPGRELLVDDKICVALFGQPYWTAPELAAEARRTSNAAAALLAYRRRGRELFADLHGEFGLIVLDRERREALLAIDRLGIQPMSFSLIGKRGLVFATGSTAVARHPAVRAEVSSQGIYNYLFFYRVPAPGTIFSGVGKLLPAQYLHLGSGQVEKKFYWQMPFAERRAGSRGELAEGLRASLRSSVKRAVAGAPWDRLGTFLSGGLDSSTVTGFVSELAPAPVKAFTIGFDTPGYDERDYAVAAAYHFGVDHCVYVVTPEDVLAAVERIAAAYDEPFGNASAVPVYYCARFARSEGVETLIAGDGGDELFAGNASHLRMKLFELYGRLPAALRRKLIEPIADWPPLARAHWLGRKASSYVAGARTPMPDRMFGLSRAVPIGAAAMIEPERLAEIDPDEPVRILREVYERPAAAAFEQRVHQLELQVVLADNDLRKVNRMCALGGVDVRFPMLGEEIACFSAALPPELFLRGLKLRAFFKEAMAGFLPEMTLRKQKHGFGLPVAPWLAPGTALQAFAYDCLDSLRARRLLRRDFIDGAIGRHRADPEAHNADPIWDMMMLELWMAAHAPAAAAGTASAPFREAPAAEFGRVVQLHR